MWEVITVLNVGNLSTTVSSFVNRITEHIWCICSTFILSSEKSVCYIHSHFTSWLLLSQWLQTSVSWLCQFFSNSTHFVFTSIFDVLGWLVWPLLSVCPFINSLHNFVACCTFSMSSPLTFVTWWWMFMGETAFGYSDICCMLPLLQVHD
jgi:hypothetical protein